MAKNFEVPTSAFITRAQEQIPEAAEIDIDNIQLPAGYRIVREAKSKRLQLLITPTTLANLKTAAALDGLSLNELCNRILDGYLTKGGK